MYHQQPPFQLIVVDGERPYQDELGDYHVVAAFSAMTDAMAFSSYYQQQLTTAMRLPQVVTDNIIAQMCDRAPKDQELRWRVVISPKSRLSQLDRERNNPLPGMGHWDGPGMPPQEPAEWGRGPQPHVGPSPFGGPGTYMAPMNKQPPHGRSQFEQFSQQPKYRMEQPGHTCQFCLRPYRAGLVIDDEILEKIKPVMVDYKEESLCPTCIVVIIVEMGVGSAGQLRLILDNHRL